MSVNINGIGIGGYQDGKQKDKKSKAGQDFKAAFAGSLFCQEEKRLDRKTVGAAGINIIARNRVTEAGVTCDSAIKECAVRNITMEESDYVKPCPADGCLYKVLVDTKKGVAYVEKKAEDGTVLGYEVEVSKVKKGDEDPLKLLAMLAWQKVVEENEEAEAKARAKDAVRQMKNQASENAAANGRPAEMTDFQRALLSFAEFVEDRIKNGEPKIPIGAQEFSETDWKRLLETFDKAMDEIKKEVQAEAEQAARKAEEEKAVKKAAKEKLLSKFSSEGKAPYSWLADESGCITYNGVVFSCDNESRCINLGDMSNRDNVLSIPLSGGGTLNVNRDNLGDLARAIGMFSPEDVKRIMTAIATDAQCQRKLLEIEEAKDDPKNLFRIS